MNKSSIWRQAYSDFLKSGLSRAQFYRSHIDSYFPKVRPSLSNLYWHFQRLDQEAVISEAAEPTAESVPEQTVVVRQIGETFSWPKSSRKRRSLRRAVPSIARQSLWLQVRRNFPSEYDFPTASSLNS